MVWQLLLIVSMIALAACDEMSAFVQSFNEQVSHAKTATYRDERFNYEIDYPADWVVEEDDYGIRLLSYKPGSLPPQYMESLPPGDVRIGIFPLLTDSSIPLTDIIAADIERMFPLDCVESDPIVFSLARGGQAIEIRTSSDLGGVGSFIYTALDGRYFRFDIWGRSNHAQDVVRSLRPLTPSSSGTQQEAFEVIHIEPQYYCDW